ncbi:scaffolding protein [Bifidobacterium sp. DSM 109960]|uniref:Scaffolding protein n=1 Tax=Bifidobacterium erythrocebi TaxID=2675325 RepID=A0A7Y0ETV1_9BIFI|nr:hypothetical protein [Bifidobacterium sp. DSM 109960]NMM96294.1 scaffolding protein [Bifidobacterium sp. DSM 109960]
MHYATHRRNLMRHLRLIEGGDPQGGEGEPPAGQNTDGEGDNAKNTTADNAKEFSHALAARVEEEKAKLEAKYAGYDEYKAKAAKYDANESDNASKLEAAGKRIESLTKEIAALKATAEREALIDQIAKDTGLGRDVISRLKGDGDELKANAKALKDSLKPNLGLPTPPAGKPATGTTGGMTPLQLLSQAYAAK